VILFDNVYSGDTVFNMDQEVTEFFSDSLIDDFDIPQDDNGILRGTFRVIVEWTPE